MVVKNSCGQTITQYNVQTGDGANNLNQVAPSATSGVPLVSSGAAVQPAFGTAVVAGGGTGNTTFTAYSVIAAGTTATGAFQNVSGVGSAGQVLTSNGASTLPTWQGTGNSPTANSVVSLVDDFIVCIMDQFKIYSSLCWSQTGFNFSSRSASLASTNPGVMGIAAGSTVSYLICSSTGASSVATTCFILGGGVLTCNWIFKINALSVGGTRYCLNIGLGDSITGSDQANGAYFKYEDDINSGQWQILTAAASSRTTTNTATAVTTGWHKATIVVNAAATSIEFFMDGVSMGSIVATIPTLQTGPAVKVTPISSNVIALDTIAVDLMYLNQTLTTAR